MLSSSPNQHVEEVIRSYLAKPPFGALLITGDWGSGKTYIVKNSPSIARSNAVYASANGAASIEELRKRIIYSAFPILGDKTMRTLGSIAASALGMLRINLKIDVDQIVQLDSVNELIIDDIERVTFGIEEALGYLNGLCEHEGKHVILIGDYGQLEQKGSFKRIQEKTIGKTVAVYPDFLAGVESVKPNVSENYLEFLMANVQAIRDIFSAIGSTNLRVLKQIVFEFEDLFPIVSTGSLSPDVRLKVFRQFVIFSLAWKLGRLSREDIRSRSQYRYAGLFDTGKQSDKTPVQHLADIFSGDDIFHLYIDNEFLETKVCDGLSVMEKLERGLQDIKTESDPSVHPEWRILWHYLDHDAATIEAAYNKFRGKFRAREYRDSGEILHSFGIIIEMQRAKLDRRKIDSVVPDCKRYIDDLYKRGELPPLSDDIRGDWRFGSAHGLGFMNIETPQFAALLSHYRAQSLKLRSDNLLKNLISVLDNLEDNISVFEAIVSDFADPMSILRDPLFTKVPSKKLANAILECSGSAQGRIIRALSQRYYHNPEILEKEGSWLKALVANLRRISSKRPAPTPFRINKLIDLALGEELSRSESSSVDPSK